MKKILLWFLQSKLWSFFIIHILWRFRLSTGYTKLSGYDFERMRKALKPGDFLFSKDKAKVVSYLIPGEVSHAAIYIDPLTVVEATHSGVQTTSLFEFCKEADLVIPGRCELFSDDYRHLFCLKALSFVGKPYDAALGLGTEALYCSELIYQSDINKLVNYDLSDLVGLGRPYISPQGILDASNVVRI